MNCRYYFFKILFFCATFFAIYSCKKQSTDTGNVQSHIKPLKGYYELVKQDAFVMELQPRLDTTYFRYYDSIPERQLWVSNLKSGTYGIKHARIVVSKMREKISMIFVSYTYDEGAYKTGDFSTYTGKIEVYNDMLQVYKTIHYKKGKPTNPPCRNCMEMKPPENPPLDPNWCAIFPPLCGYQNPGSGGGSNPADPNMSMPPLNDGGGGSMMTEVVLQDYKENMEVGHTFTPGGYDDTPYDDYQVGQLWPSIANVIPKTDWVGLKSSSDNCFDLASQQLAKKNYKISEYYAPGQTIQAYTEKNGADPNKAKEAVGYILNALARGIPVMVGVDNHAGSVNTQTDNSTDHFIIIVGTDSDLNGIYFRFYDSATSIFFIGTHDNNKLYYNPATGMLKGKSWTSYAQDSRLHDYIVTQVRKSKTL